MELTVWLSFSFTENWTDNGYEINSVQLRGTVLRSPKSAIIHCNISVMIAKNVFFLILLQETVNVAVLAVGESGTFPHSAYFMIQENKRLQDKTEKQLESSSLMSCNQICMKIDWCTSTNFKMPSNDGKGTCELNKHGAVDINTTLKLRNQQGVTFSMLLKVNIVFLSTTKLSQGRARVYGGWYRN